jgi:hypothetical protein
MRLIIGENINCTLNICKTDNCTLIFLFSIAFLVFLVLFCLFTVFLVFYTNFLVFY